MTSPRGFGAAVKILYSFSVNPQSMRVLTASDSRTQPSPNATAARTENNFSAAAQAALARSQNFLLDYQKPEGGLGSGGEIVFNPGSRGVGRRLRPGITCGQHAHTLRIHRKAVKNFNRRAEPARTRHVRLKTV